jgi:hypothetical protein
LIAALGGTGSFPCWISEALCATAGGSAGPAPAGVTPPCPGAPFAPGDPCGPPALGCPLGPLGCPLGPPGEAGPGWDGWLMTLLMTVVLWILTKMMLFGGGTM